MLNMMNIHLHKKKTLIFVFILLIKLFGVLYVYFKLGNSASDLKVLRYEFIQQKKILKIQDSLKKYDDIGELSIYDLKKVSFF